MSEMSRTYTTLMFSNFSVKLLCYFWKKRLTLLEGSVFLDSGYEVVVLQMMVEVCQIRPVTCPTPPSFTLCCFLPFKKKRKKEKLSLKTIPLNFVNRT